MKYKPAWITSENWAKFLKIHLKGDGLTCVACGTNEDMTVDHIVPRILGGSSAVSNLQPMCRPCNSSKGTSPDNYWKRQFYFDTPLDKEKLRVSQSDFIIGPIEEYAEFFSRPFSSINRKLFLYAQIVGAGKTMGLFTLPFALNSVIGTNIPRIDKMLVVTKDMPLRAQIARELKEEPALFGIVPDEARVAEIITMNDIVNPEEEHDIAVMCPNMLWPDKDGQNVELGVNGKSGTASEVFVNWKPHMEKILETYPLIVFDETHYAHTNISRLVKNATNNLIFGFTASPVDANGELLDDMVKMSVYGYNEAVINDNSMKWLGDTQ